MTPENIRYHAAGHLAAAALAAGLVASLYLRGLVFDIRAGKLHELWLTWDNMTILRQLGMLPEGF